MTASERSKEWVRFAYDDLRSAQALLKEEIFNEVCFHSQQCAEKMLKGLLVIDGTVVPKTHRLIDLLAEALKYHSLLERIREDCLILDQYYIPTRYPDAVIGSKPTGLPSRKDAEEALQIAQTIFSTVQSILESKQK
jgi:HEPN domain-containing protein